MLAQVNEALQASRIVSLCEVNIGSARMLPSGDWRFRTAIPKRTELLRIHHGELVKTVRPVARIAIPTYGVIVDGIRVSLVNQEDWSEVIGQIRQQNMGVLTPERNIGSLHWLTKPKRQFCSLVIEFTEAAACNAVVGARELFWCNELRKVRRFVPGCNINQYFKCYQYGHRSTQCKNPSVCGYCSDPEHVAAACPSQSCKGRPKCPLCSGSHPAWRVECKKRKDQKKRSREKAEAAPRFWPEPTKTVSISPGPSPMQDFESQVPSTAGVKRPGRPLQPVSSSRSNLKTKPGGITKTHAPKNKTKSSKTSAAQAVKFLQARDIAAALGQNKENEARDVEMKEDDEDEAGSFQLSRPSEASGGPVIRRKPRAATANIHKDHE
ncbi:MAG: hypothetical protein Q9171_004800 [Xanthocarpia ochracea]